MSIWATFDFKKRTIMNPIYSTRILEMQDEDGTAINDTERYALFYLLAINDDLYSKRHHIYDFKKHEIKPDCLDKIDFCSSSRKLIRLGFNLYNDYHPADVSGTLMGLDENSVIFALKAITIRFGLIRLEEKIVTLEELKEKGLSDDDIRLFEEYAYVPRE